MLKRKDKSASTENPNAAPQPGKEEISGLGTVAIRNEFYRDGYRSLLKMTLIQSIAILGLVISIYYIVSTHQPQYFYFATTEDGRLMPMLPLDQPNLSSPALMSWVAQSATEVLTFGFNDYRRRLQDSSRNFTKRGWESFTQALQRSRIIEMMEANQQVLNSAPRGAPVLVSESVVAGRYQWIVEIPLVLTYLSGSKSQSSNLLVTVVVVRVPRLESSNGVGIEQWVAVQR